MVVLIQLNVVEYVHIIQGILLVRNHLRKGIKQPSQIERKNGPVDLVEVV